MSFYVNNWLQTIRHSFKKKAEQGPLVHRLSCHKHRPVPHSSTGLELGTLASVMVCSFCRLTVFHLGILPFASKWGGDLHIYQAVKVQKHFVFQRETIYVIAITGKYSAVCLWGSICIWKIESFCTSSHCLVIYMHYRQKQIQFISRVYVSHFSFNGLQTRKLSCSLKLW